MSELSHEDEVVPMWAAFLGAIPLVALTACFAILFGAIGFALAVIWAISNPKGQPALEPAKSRALPKPRESVHIIRSVLTCPKCGVDAHLDKRSSCWMCGRGHMTRHEEVALFPGNFNVIRERVPLAQVDEHLARSFSQMK